MEKTKIINKLNEAKDNFPALGFSEEYVRGFNQAFKMAVFIVEELTKKEPQPDSGWIPVTKWDKSTLDVRVKLFDGSELNCWSQSDGDFYNKELNVFIDISHVIDVMPLPSPPEVK